MTPYKDLEQYGLIGNLRTCALVADDGSVDWVCFPHIESASLFAALLDSEKGGQFLIQPRGEFQSDRSYAGETNVLETRFRNSSGRMIVTDFMPVNMKGGILKNALIRRLECTKGSVDLQLLFKPRFEFARVNTTVSKFSEGVVATAGNERCYLTAPIPVQIDSDQASSEFTLESGDVSWFILSYGKHHVLTTVQCEKVLEQTLQFWQNWAHKCDKNSCVFAGPWHGQVIRSALLLKLLTHIETGAIAAAATTSVPKRKTGEENLDFRYNFVRDSSCTIQALYNLGHISESKEFLEWITKVGSQTGNPSDLQAMYGLHGETEIPEMELLHLSGYRYARPVKIGSMAVRQHRHDIFGEFIQAVYETNRYGEHLSEEVWNFVINLADHVCDIWAEPDTGIWQAGDGKKHFVYSKVMCWVALDRAIKMAVKIGGNVDSSKWRENRFRLKNTIITEGFNKKRNSFVQTFGEDNLDASVLLIPKTGFLDFQDDRILSTIRSVQKNLTEKNGLVYRYKSQQGLLNDDNVSLVCSFWLVDALALSERLAEAERLFREILSFATPLGLFAESIETRSGAQLGNFPYAFSHISLINSALYLGRLKGTKIEGPEPYGLYGVID